MPPPLPRLQQPADTRGGRRYPVEPGQPAWPPSPGPPCCGARRAQGAAWCMARHGAWCMARHGACRAVHGTGHGTARHGTQHGAGHGAVPGAGCCTAWCGPAHRTAPHRTVGVARHGTVTWCSASPVPACVPSLPRLYVCLSVRAVCMSSGEVSPCHCLVLVLRPGVGFVPVCPCMCLPAVGAPSLRVPPWGAWEGRVGERSRCFGSEWLWWFIRASSTGCRIH